MDENIDYTTQVRPRNQWSKEADCANLPIQTSEKVFFIKQGRPSKSQPYVEFCSQCPVVNECLSWALVHDAYGIWGGMTRTQRLQVPRQIVKHLKKSARLQGWLEKGLFEDEILQDQDRNLERIQPQKYPARGLVTDKNSSLEIGPTTVDIGIPDFQIEDVRPTAPSQDSSLELRIEFLVDVPDFSIESA